MKLLASHLGGTRNPMVVRWPKKITADPAPREVFLHCNDVVPTIYEIVGIEAPRVVHGEPQIPLAGASFAHTLADGDAPGGKKTQYFEIMGSRGIYHDGWMACARGPRLPWVPGQPEGIATWTPDNDAWELYHLDEDWSQANDLADQLPDKLIQMREMFAIEAARNAVLPVGGGLWVPVYHPELRIAPPYREWEFSGDMVRMPEFCAPALGNKNNIVTIDAEIPANANGVLYALGAAAGGLTCYFDDGYLCYEYNLFILARTKIRSAQKIGPGTATITVATQYAEQRPAGPLDITVTVNGDTVAAGQVPVSAPLLFTANDCLDIGTCLGSPVSLDYRERAPFPFEGRIRRVHVAYA
jgi:arylsulfatase